MDLGEYLDQWMVRQRLRLRPRTWDAYQLTIATYIAPALGDVALPDLGPAAIEHLYGELLDHGGRGDRPLSLATIRHVHGVLHKALADAVRTDLLTANPADRVALPRRDLRDDSPATVQAWTAEEARRFLQQTRADQHAALWAVALGTGMRRGELLGLRWRDVDLDDGLVTVTGALTEHRGQVQRAATKTSRVRRLYIDDRTAAALVRERRTRGPTTAATRDLTDLVFTDADGAPLSPQRTTHRFRRLVRRLDGVPAIRLHEMRHTHATLLLQAGVPIKSSCLGGSISERAPGGCVARRRRRTYRGCTCDDGNEATRAWETRAEHPCRHELSGRLRTPRARDHRHDLGLRQAANPAAFLTAQGAFGARSRAHVLPAMDREAAERFGTLLSE